MSQPFQPNLDFTAAATAAEDGEALIVDLEGYEGPLHVLLALPSGRIDGNLYELMSAYIGQRVKEVKRHYTPRPPQAYPLEDARDRLRKLLPELERWTPLAGVA